MKTTKPSTYEQTLLPSFRFYERMKLAYAAFGRPRVFCVATLSGSEIPLTAYEIRAILEIGDGAVIDFQTVTFDGVKTIFNDNPEDRTTVEFSDEGTYAVY